MLYRISVANVAHDVIAACGQGAGLGGTITAALGFGAWGVEPTAVVESAESDASKVDTFLRALFANSAEEAVYLTTDGTAPRLVWRDGRVEPLDVTAAK